MNDVMSIDNGTLIPLAGMLVGVIAILCGATVAITKVVSAHYRRSQLDEMEATLKMEMIQRGMAADEITKVLGARMSANKSKLGELLDSLPQVQMRAFGKKCEKS